MTSGNSLLHTYDCDSIKTLEFPFCINLNVAVIRSCQFLALVFKFVHIFVENWSFMQISYQCYPSQSIEVYTLKIFDAYKEISSVFLVGQRFC